MSSSSSSSAEMVLHPAAISSCWMRMFSILATSSVPYCCAALSASPGVSVWTCTLNMSSPSLMTMLSPIEFKYSRNGARSRATVLRTMKTVSNVKVMSSSPIVLKSALSRVSRASSKRGISSPRSAESMPLRMTTKPLPPASITPARLSTGFMLTVSLSVSSPWAMACSRTYSMSLRSSAACLARSAARRETVRMVPSAGFMTAL